MNEFADALFFGFAVGQDLFSEIFVSEDEGSASAQLNQQSNLKFALKGKHLLFSVSNKILLSVAAPHQHHGYDCD